MKIIDFHTHFGKGFPHIEFKGGNNRIRTFGLMRIHELSGFRRFFLKGEPSRLIRIMILKEQKKRLSRASSENLLKDMKRSGITFSCVHPVEPYVWTGDVIEECGKREGLIPFLSVSPNDPKMAVKIEDYIKKGAKGIKVHPVLQRFDPESTEFFELLEEFAPYDLPLITHTGRSKYFENDDPCELFGRVERFEKAVRTFKSVKFVFAHMGMHTPDKAVEMAVRYRNIFLETSFQEAKVIYRALKELSAERLVFGSDWPCADPLISKKIVLSLVKDDPCASSLIFHINAESLMRI